GVAHAELGGEAEERDRDHRHRDRGAHGEPHLEHQVERRRAEDHAEDGAEDDRPRGEFRQLRLGRDVGMERGRLLGSGFHSERGAHGASCGVGNEVRRAGDEPETRTLGGRPARVNAASGDPPGVDRMSRLGSRPEIMRIVRAFGPRSGRSIMHRHPLASGIGVLVAACLVVVSSSLAADAPPVAPGRHVTDGYWGQKVEDPYRYMENLKDKEVQDWFKSQADYTSALIARLPERDKILARIQELEAGRPYRIFQIDRRADGRLFYLRMAADEDLP